MRSWRHAALLAVVVVLALSIPGAGAVAAQEDGPPPVPPSFYGTVTVDGEPAPAGTEVVALVEGEERGSIIVGPEGSYGGASAFEEKLVVDGSSGDEGATIAFEVDGQAADRTATWTGGAARLDLSVASDGATDSPGGGTAPGDPGDGSTTDGGDEPGGDGPSGDRSSDDPSGDDTNTGDTNGGDPSEDATPPDGSGDDGADDAPTNATDDRRQGESGDDRPQGGATDGDDTDGAGDGAVNDESGDEAANEESGGEGRTDAETTGDGDRLPGFGSVATVVALATVTVLLARRSTA